MNDEAPDATPYGYTPTSEDDLLRYVREQLNREHDYNSCPDAVANAAVSMFNYAARVLGITGFQASAADLRFLRMTRGYKGPFGILDGSHLLYPQYDLRAQVEEWIERWTLEWAAGEARDRLASVDTDFPPAEAVLDHWRKLAGQEVVA